MEINAMEKRVSSSNKISEWSVTVLGKEARNDFSNVKKATFGSLSSGTSCLI